MTSRFILLPPQASCNNIILTNISLKLYSDTICWMIEQKKQKFFLLWAGFVLVGGGKWGESYQGCEGN